jgi:hypothetical protein
MWIQLHRERTAAIMSMILTPFHRPKILQMTSIIFLTGLGTKPFVKYAGKFSYILSSSVSRGWWNADPGPRVGGRGGSLVPKKKSSTLGKRPEKAIESPN